LTTYPVSGQRYLGSKRVFTFVGCFVFETTRVLRHRRHDDVFRRCWGSSRSSARAQSDSFPPARPVPHGSVCAVRGVATVPHGSVCAVRGVGDGGQLSCCLVLTSFRLHACRVSASLSHGTPPSQGTLSITMRSSWLTARMSRSRHRWTGRRAERRKLQALT
jgi:hypothetical protein